MHVEFAMQERQLQQHDGRVVHEELRLLDSRLQRRLPRVDLHVEQVRAPELVLDQRGGNELLLPWMHLQHQLHALPRDNVQAGYHDRRNRRFSLR